MRIAFIYIITFIFISNLICQNEDAYIKFQVPTNGKIASLFGWRYQKNKLGIKEKKYHTGVDIAGKWGEPIYAAASGKVVFVGRNGGYGLFIELEHNQRYSSGYGHLKTTCVKSGQVVNSGEIIGYMGNSGTTFSTIGGKGVHLHFEIRDNQKKKWYSPKGAIDPVKIIFKNKKIKKYDDLYFEPELNYLVSYSPVLLPEYMENITVVSKEKTDNSIVEKQEYNPIIIEPKKVKHIVHNPEISENLNYRKVNYQYSPDKKPVLSQTNFAIQVEAHQHLLSDNELKIMEKKYQTGGIRWDIVDIKGENWYKYTIGSFDDLDEAKRYQKKLNIEKNIKLSAVCVFADNKIIKTIW